MPKITLSDVGLRSLQLPIAGQLDYWDDKFPAFGVRVSQGGAKTFVLNIHNARRSIGRYPIISLAEARQEAKRLLAEKTLGKSRPQSVPYAKALDEFLEEKQKTRRPATYQNLRLRLKQHFTFKGPIAGVTHQDVSRRLAKIPSSSEHDHALSVAKTFFTWAMNRRYITDSPVRGISPHGHTSRARVLSDAELQSIWQACEVGESPVQRQAEEPRLPCHFRTIVKLLMLTGQRRGEIAALQTTWINDHTITLPAEITKNGREHTFPLAALTASTIKASSAERTGYIFPARGSLHGPFNGWSKSKHALDKLSGVYGWTLHDLRRTFATRLAAFTAPHVIEKLLNHVSGTISGVAAIYNRHAYEDECRAAVTEWERRLLEIVNAEA